MQKNLICIEIKKDQRTYQLLADPNSPLGELYDVLMEMRSHVISLMAPKEQQAQSEGVKIDKIEYIPNDQA